MMEKHRRSPAPKVITQLAVVVASAARVVGAVVASVAVGWVGAALQVALALPIRAAAVAVAVAPI